RRLQAVGDVAGQLLVDAHRLLADRRVEGVGALDRLLRRLGGADDLDQRDHGRRGERNAGNAPPPVGRPPPLAPASLARGGPEELEAMMTCGASSASSWP